MKIGLALSGGIARGPVHVGILSVLAQENIPIHCIAGASAGSLIGAAYCAGMPIKEIRRLSLSTNWRHVARPVWPKRGLVTFAPLERFVERNIGRHDIEDLALPYSAVATDLLRGERVLLQHGRLSRAVRASCSIPGLVTPVEVDGRLLCDGGVADNLPVDAARMLGADYVIGVDLFVPAKRSWGPLGIGAAALETLVRTAGGGTRDADCLIVPNLAGKTYLRFSQSEEYIALGEAAAREAMPIIRRDLAHLLSTPV